MTLFCWNRAFKLFNYFFVILLTLLHFCIHFFLFVCKSKISGSLVYSRFTPTWVWVFVFVCVFVVMFCVGFYVLDELTFGEEEGVWKSLFFFIFVESIFDEEWVCLSRSSAIVMWMLAWDIWFGKNVCSIVFAFIFTELFIWVVCKYSLRDCWLSTTIMLWRQMLLLFYAKH